MNFAATRQARPSADAGSTLRAMIAICMMVLLGVIGGARTQAAAEDWMDVDIGTPPNGQAGRTVEEANGAFKMRGVGDDITHTPPAQLHFHYVTIDGDFELIARKTEAVLGQIAKFRERGQYDEAINLLESTPASFILTSVCSIVSLARLARNATSTMVNALM